MIKEVLFVDEAGNLIFSKKFDSDIQIEPSLISNFLTAMIQFGEEVLDIPERLNFKNYSIVFYSLKRTKTYHIFVITDTHDSYNATLRFVKKLYCHLKDLIEKIDSMETLVVDSNMEKEFHRRVDVALKESIRLFRSWRSGGSKSIILSAVTTFLCSVSLYTAVYNILNITPNPAIESLIILSVSTLLGIIGGTVAGVPKEGAIGSWLGHFISILPTAISSLQSSDINSVIAFLLLGGIVAGSYVATLGFIFGLAYDYTFLR